jgi:putative ABC transport system permease protein
MPVNQAGAMSLGLRDIRRQLRSQPAVVISIFTAVLVATFLVAAAPRLLEEVSSQDLYATVNDAAPAQRNIRVERSGRLGAGADADPLQRIRDSGDSFAADEIPPSVAAITSSHYFLIDTPRFRVAPLPGEDPPHPFPMFLGFRYQEHIEDHITLIEGAMPTPQEPITMLVGADCPVEEDERERLSELLELGETEEIEDLDCQLQDVPHFQVAVSEPTAEAMGLEIDRQMILRPDATDPPFLAISGETLDYQIVMSISGIIELADPSLEYFYGDPQLHRPAIQENADLRIVFATGLLSPDDYGSLSRLGGVSWRYTWRHFVEPELVRDANIDVLQAQLTPFELTYSSLVARPNDPTVSTQLSRLLAAHLDQRSQTVAMMSLAVAGIFSSVVAVTLLLAVLMTVRQRTSIVLNRNRGATGAQLSLTRVYEGMFLTVPAALIGYGGASWLLADTDGFIAYRATVTLVAVSIVAILAAALPLLRQRLGSLQFENEAQSTSTSRRLVVEMFVLVLAAGAVVLLRRRGQIENPSTTAEFDLLLATVPVLVGLAAGLITMRLYPPAIRLLSWIGSKNRGIVVFVGFRRILQHSFSARLPVLVFIICVVTATFTVVTRASIMSGQEASSWQAVGADYAVKGVGPDINVPASIDFDGLGPIDDIAFGKTFPDASVVSERSRAPAAVMAIEVDGLSRVAEGTPVDSPLLGLSTQAGTEAGSEAAPIPVIASTNWPFEGGVRPGDMITLDLGRLRPFAVVTEVRDRFPDLPDDRPFVIVSLETLESMSELPLPPTVAYLRAPRSSGETLTDTIAEQAPSARLISRYENLEAVAEDPFVSWAVRGLGIVFVFATTLAILAAVSSLALGSARRTRDFGYLRTMGLDTRQATSMTVIEQVPSVLVGTLVGALVGVGTAILLDPAIDLDPFTGNLVPTEVTVSWPVIALLALSLIVALGVAVTVFVLVNRRTDLGRVLRVGDE